jgi:hypothetical protein
MNDIAAVNIATTLPLFFDPYRQNRTTGSFVLLDPISNATVAAGMIEGSSHANGASSRLQGGPPSSGQFRNLPTATGELAPLKQKAAAVWIVGRPRLAEKLAHAALQQEWQAQIVSGLEFRSELQAIATILQRMGVIAIFSLAQSDDDSSLKLSVASIFREEFVFHADLPDADTQALAEILEWLRSVRETRSPEKEKP